MVCHDVVRGKYKIDEIGKGTVGGAGYRAYRGYRDGGRLVKCQCPKLNGRSDNLWQFYVVVTEGFFYEGFSKEERQGGVL
jgi:hypothetical protein